MISSGSITFILTLLLGVFRHGELTNKAVKDTFFVDPFVNTTCMDSNCLSAYTTCINQPKCKQLLSCLVRCYDDFTTDPSPMKSKTQACIYTCTFSYADFYYTGLARCLTDYKCLDLPPISTHCRYPDQVVTTKKYNITDLRDGWWVVKGFNLAYDCVACQHTFFDAVQYEKDNYVYRPTFESHNEDGSYTLVNGSILVPLVNNQPGDPINLDYYLYGVPMHLTWHVLNGISVNNTFYHDNSTVLVYYCGDINTQWYFEGALILTRSPALLSPDADTQFAKMVEESTNLEYERFCSPQVEPCPN